MTKHVIISTHCDDAMLSLGGHILLNPNTEVITVFGTCAWTALDEPMSSSEITRRNQSEDRRCMHEAQAELTIYEFPEALLRGYRKWNAKKLHAKDTYVQAKITTLLKQKIIGAQNIYFPMASGRHVDHVIVSSQINHLYDQLSENGAAIYVYEDLPYSWYGGLEEALDRLRKNFELTPVLLDVSNVMKRKVELLRYYETQLLQSDLDKVTEYAATLIESGFGERIWQVQKR